MMDPAPLIRVNAAAMTFRLVGAIAYGSLRLNLSKTRVNPAHSGGEVSGAAQAALFWCLLSLHISLERLDSGSACATSEIRSRPQHGALAEARNMGIQEPHPSGRRGFQIVDQHTDRQPRRIFHEQVNMVFFTIELKDAAVEFFAS